jgi:hypothetical protein
MTNPLLTSIPYPALLFDRVFLGVSLTSGSLRSTLIKQPMADTLNLSVGINTFTMRDLVRAQVLPPDTMTLNLQVSEVTLRTLLRTFTVKPDDVVNIQTLLQTGSLKNVLRVISGYFQDTCNISCNLTSGSLV